ncbi:MAG TPA: hypothetical protein VHD15_18515 [Hyphomicrobiales bacterium]|nr:hypothetical protein [Hyphomicrobiales bacterium]
MMRPLLALLALTLASPVAAETTASPDATATSETGKVPPAVAAVAPEVALVRIIGPWDTAEQRGFSRLVVVVKDGVPTLHVQWLADSGSGQGAAAVESVVVKGAEAVPSLPLAEVAVDPGRNDAEVTFALPHPKGAEGESYVLDVGLPGDARFGPESH